MADLYSITAPLLIRYADGSMDVMVECLPHTDGIIYFKPFWNQMPLVEGICFASGVLRGGGPWKVSDAVITVLGCHGTHPEQAAEYAEWQAYREQHATDYPGRDALRQLAHTAGYLA